ncbi:sugar-transfer associated ATP-grasp domain-containing protein [Micrococcus terreus]|uniref:sugar-transfer associated ATP-grasp domain-containing protein n=1 Tax=Micrococcus terreus TaxID=574650 RepID=UPI003D7652DA
MRSIINNLAVSSRSWSQSIGFVDFIRYETRIPQRFRSPHLLKRGFHSDRNLLYPAEFEIDPFYISDFRYSMVARSLNPMAVQRELASKPMFHKKMQASGYADSVPLNYGIVKNGHVTPLAEYSGGPVFTKPTSGKGARDIQAWQGLDMALSSLPDRGDYLVQELLEPHSLVSKIFPDALNVLRVVAIRPQLGEPALVVSAIQRFATSLNAPKDTFGDGGLLVDVDSSTGKLGTVVGVPKGRRMVMNSHPDTKEQISGLVLPYFREACDLVLSAMDVWPNARFVGWDVALTNRGPVLIEGNASWTNLMMMQIAKPLSRDEGAVHWFKSIGLTRG